MRKNFSIPEIEQLVAISEAQIEEMSYEDSMEYLERVVEALEQEGTPLKLGFRLYEVGNFLSQRCEKVLDSTEAKMVQLLGEGEKSREEPFDPGKDGR